MTKFKQSDIPQSEVDRAIADIIEKWQCGNEAIRALFKGCSEVSTVGMEARRIILDEYRDTKTYLNDIYQVMVKNVNNEWVRLSIKRIDRAPIHDWRHLQRIKSELVGPECEAVEMYPAESRVVDTANQYWLHCCTDPKYRFPFGFNEGRIINEESVAGSVQRPFEKEQHA